VFQQGGGGAEKGGKRTRVWTEGKRTDRKGGNSCGQCSDMTATPTPKAFTYTDDSSKERRNGWMDGWMDGWMKQRKVP